MSSSTEEPTPNIDGPVRPAPAVRRARGCYDFDPSDKRAVAGRASVVFIGEVISEIGHTPRKMGRSGFPQTQFNVRVITSLKGERLGFVPVNQMGGHDSRGTLMLINRHTLLQVGNIYLLAAIYSTEFRWYTVMSGGGVRSVPSADAVAEFVAEWRDAVANGTASRRPPSPPPPGR